MPQPTDEEIKSFVALQRPKWNAHDQQGYLEAWKSIAKPRKLLEIRGFQTIDLTDANDATWATVAVDRAGYGRN